MRRTIAAPLTTSRADNHDRQRCSLCGLLILDGLESGHEDQHIRNRDAGRPTFTPVEAIDVEHDPAAREGGGIQYGPITESPKEN